MKSAMLTIESSKEVTRWEIKSNGFHKLLLMVPEKMKKRQYSELCSAVGKLNWFFELLCSHERENVLQELQDIACDDIACLHHQLMMVYYRARERTPWKPREDTSYDVSLAICSSPQTGEYQIESLDIFGTMNNPEVVGLTVVSLPPKKGEFARIRIYGYVPRDIVNTHNVPFMYDKKVLYKKGWYDFIAIQKERQDWSGWFND